MSLFSNPGRAAHSLGPRNVAAALLLVVLTAWMTPPAHAGAMRGRGGGYRDNGARFDARAWNSKSPGGTYRHGRNKPFTHAVAPHLKTALKLDARKPAAPRRGAKSTRLASASPAAEMVRVPRRPHAGSEFLRGVFGDGPKHMWHSMVKRPSIFFGGIAAVGALGAMGAIFELHTEPAVIVAGIAALGLQLWAGIKAVRQAPREMRARAIGAELAFPTLVWAGSSVAAMSLGHGPTTGGAGQAAAKAMLFGGEAPANLSMATSGAKRRDTH